MASSTKEVADLRRSGSSVFSSQPHGQHAWVADCFRFSIVPQQLWRHAKGRTNSFFDVCELDQLIARLENVLQCRDGEFQRDGLLEGFAGGPQAIQRASDLTTIA